MPEIKELGEIVRHCMGMNDRSDTTCTKRLTWFVSFIFNGLQHVIIVLNLVIGHGILR